MHRAGEARRVARAGVKIRPDREPVARGVHRDRNAKLVTRLQACDIDIVAAGVALADRRRERPAGETRVGEREQTHRAGEARHIPRAGVGIRPHRESVACGVQRHGAAKQVGRLQA